MKRLGIWVLGTIAAIIVGFVLTPIVQNKLEARAQAERLHKAEAMFAERCKTAGEKIHRTVKDVEGIYLLKLRPKERNRGNQFEMDDPYGDDFSGDAYIKSFIRGFWEESRPEKPNQHTPPRIGYLYVEANDPIDGKRYRYTGAVEEVTHTSSVLMGGDGRSTFKSTEFVLKRELASGDPPRYVVTYDDISTHEEREYWIAGSSLKVIDLHTNEIIAERIGYMMDRAQGSDAGSRAPWLWAADNACPNFASKRGFTAQAGQAEKFVGKVLHPKLEK